MAKGGVHGCQGSMHGCWGAYIVKGESVHGKGGHAKIEQLNGNRQAYVHSIGLYVSV